MAQVHGGSSYLEAHGKESKNPEAEMPAKCRELAHAGLVRTKRLAQLLLSLSIEKVSEIESSDGVSDKLKDMIVLTL